MNRVIFVPCIICKDNDLINFLQKILHQFRIVREIMKFGVRYSTLRNRVNKYFKIIIEVTQMIYFFTYGLVNFNEIIA